MSCTVGKGRELHLPVSGRKELLSKKIQQSVCAKGRA